MQNASIRQMWFSATGYRWNTDWHMSDLCDTLHEKMTDKYTVKETKHWLVWHTAWTDVTLHNVQLRRRVVDDQENVCYCLWQFTISNYYCYYYYYLHLLIYSLSYFKPLETFIENTKTCGLTLTLQNAKTHYHASLRGVLTMGSRRGWVMCHLRDSTKNFIKTLPSPYAWRLNSHRHKVNTWDSVVVLHSYADSSWCSDGTKLLAT